MKVVFLCTGNVNRSAAARAVALECGFTSVASYGTSNAAKSGNPMAKRTRVPLVAAGVSEKTVQAHRSRWAGDATLTTDCVIVGFQPSHRSWAREHAPRCEYHNFADFVASKAWGDKIPDPGFDARIAPAVVNVIVKTTPDICRRFL